MSNGLTVGRTPHMNTHFTLLAKSSSASVRLYAQVLMQDTTLLRSESRNSTVDDPSGCHLRQSHTLYDSGDSTSECLLQVFQGALEVLKELCVEGGNLIF